MKNVIVFFIIILFLSCKRETDNSISLTKNNTEVKNLNASLKDNFQGFYKSENIFLGDSILAMKNYFDSLTDDNGYSILKQQNDF